MSASLFNCSFYSKIYTKVFFSIWQLYTLQLLRFKEILPFEMLIPRSYLLSVCPEKDSSLPFVDQPEEKGML